MVSLPANERGTASIAADESALPTLFRESVARIHSTPMLQPNTMEDNRRCNILDCINERLEPTQHSEPQVAGPSKLCNETRFFTGIDQALTDENIVSQAEAKRETLIEHSLPAVRFYQHTAIDPVSSGERPGNINSNHQHLQQFVTRQQERDNNFPASHASMPFNPPTAEQVAARQIMPKELPRFAGDPNEWPLFISSFELTSDCCGYSNVENLMRLQRCLYGGAKEAVRSKLMLPASVPEIIQTLRLLYGRPELIISSLLKQVREVPTPKADKLETLVTFGLAVQNFCGHLQAAGQQQHLSNPILLQELVDKLPAHIKLDWALNKRAIPNATLAHLGEYMGSIVSAASSVTLNIAPDVGCNRKERNQMKDRNFLNAHDAMEKAKGIASAVNTATRNSSEAHEKTCSVCRRAGHMAATCKEFVRLSIEDRWKEVIQKQLCRVCLGPHGRWRCKSKQICAIENCGRRHHTLLHKYETQNSLQPTETRAVTTHHKSLNMALFKIIPVILHGSTKSIETYAFLDDGSSLTLLEKNLAVELGVEGKSNPLCLVWTANVTRSEPDSQRINLEISPAGESRRYRLEDVRTVSDLMLPKQTLNMHRLTTSFEYMCGLPIKSYTEATPRLLIGINNAHLSTTQKKREGGIGQPVAVKTKLGWSVYGGTNNSLCSTNVHVTQCDCHADRELQDMVKQYFEIEQYGISAVKLESDEDRRARSILESTTKRIGQRFETGLLWKNDSIVFPESYKMALRRLQCLERRLVREPALYENIRMQIRKYVEKNYAHDITPEELCTDSSKVWYLPINIVVNPKKPGKVRLVWDAAAKVENVSLNSMLLKGPDQLVSLPTVLSNFRQRRVAISGDVEEMFHQIRIRKEDTQAQRFLWRDNAADPPRILVMDVATFGAACSPCSSLYVKNVNAEEFRNQFPRAVDAIVYNHYVDDLLDSCDNEEEAIELAIQVKTIHAAAGFNIRNWLSNSSTVLERIEGACADKQIAFHADRIASGKTDKVLGMMWDSVSDVFTFSSAVRSELQPMVYEGKIPTKREILKCVMSLFDPMGFLSHFSIHGRIIIQEVWQSGISWDDLIDERLNEQWKEWVAYFSKLGEIRIPRCYFNVPKQPENIELHIFTDASEKAYCCAAYFRTIIEGKPRSTLVCAKSKVAPIKPMSIPRLELQAAVLGARMAETICKNHNLSITKRIFWSDSFTVLSWIRSNHRRYKQFVAFRIGDLLSKTEISEWRWIPSKLNVADDGTKWANGPSFLPNARWFIGPAFLSMPEEFWPEHQQSVPETDEELKMCMIHKEHVIEEFVDISRFSKWERLLRATAYVIRFSSNCRNRARELPIESGCLKQHELKLAEHILLKIAQSSKYNEEVATLEKNGSSGKCRVIEKSSTIYKLSPFLDDDGLLRADGRITIDVIDYDARFPIILPKDHRISLLLVDWFHRKYLHANRETVVNEVKQKYHIPRMRVLIGKVRAQCQQCKISMATPRPPKMAPLPKARLQSYCRPFSFVGIDFFGPITVTVGRRQEKRWVALFTCLVIRAVHLEVTHTMTTE